MFKSLYSWTMALAHSPRAPYSLGIVSFAESSFFPIPPDVMLIPMVMAKPERAWFYAGLCTLTSVLGGILGYAIGALLYDSLGLWLIQLYGYGEKADTFRAYYQQYGAWVILIKGFTPIPFKLVTIASGLAGYDFFWFVALSIITRAGRFFFVAGLMNRFGVPIKKFIDENTTLVGVVSLAVIVLGFFMVKFVL